MPLVLPYPFNVYHWGRLGGGDHNLLTLRSGDMKLCPARGFSGSGVQLDRQGCTLVDFSSSYRLPQADKLENRA